MLIVKEVVELVLLCPVGINLNKFDLGVVSQIVLELAVVRINIFLYIAKRIGEINFSILYLKKVLQLFFNCLLYMLNDLKWFDLQDLQF